MRFRKDGLVEGLAEGFTEKEGTQLVQMHPGDPAVAQIGVAVESEFLAALLLDHAIADIDTAILHRVHIQVKSVPGVTLPRISRLFAGPREVKY